MNLTPQDQRKPDGTTKKKLGDSSEVFEGDEDHPIRRRILVYGRPGIGKSTFTQKVKQKVNPDKAEHVLTWRVHCSS